MTKAPRVMLRALRAGDAPALLALYRRNAAYLQPWEAARGPEFHTLSFQQEAIRVGLSAAADDRGYVFGIALGETGALIGRLTLSGVTRAAFQNAYLGYWIDEAHAGRGLMTEAVGLALAHAFGELRLHRVQAAALPHNVASIRVLQKSGFRYEGLAERYLLIAGRWQDHALFAITAEEWPARCRGEKE